MEIFFSYEKTVVKGIMYCNYTFKRGIPSKHNSTNYADYVPALCTHRPSLLLMYEMRISNLPAVHLGNFSR